MKHVFVETNWVVRLCAPEFRRPPEAEQLLARAEAGELLLHVPGVCLREGADAARRQVKKQPGDLREYRRWGRAQGQLSDEESAVVTSFLERYVAEQAKAVAGIDERLAALRNSSDVDVFGLDDTMLERALALRTEVVEVDLKPFDEAILAGVLTRASEVRSEDTAPMYFCTLDKKDLFPEYKGKRRPTLEAAYRDAGFTDRTTGEVTVRPDFMVP